MQYSYPSNWTPLKEIRFDEDPDADRIFVCNLEDNSELWVRFRTSRTYPSNIFFLLTVPKRFLCLLQFVFACGPVVSNVECFLLLFFCCHSLFLISVFFLCVCVSRAACAW